MKKGILIGLASFLMILFSCDSKPKETYVTIETSMGNIEIWLYNTTPLHKENFIALAKEKFFNKLLFHRVIYGFMIQGGDPSSKDAPPNTKLGMGGPGYRIQAEIGSYHFRGTLAAARDGNPDMKSSGSQFYIVQGSPVGDPTLNNIEQKQGIKYTEQERAYYKEVGGAPHLDNQYTAFGRVTEGMDVVDAIASVQVDANKRPLEDVKILATKVIRK